MTTMALMIMILIIKRMIVKMMILMMIMFYGKSKHLGISHYDGFRQDKKLCGGVHLLFKTLTTIEVRIFEDGTRT